MHELFREMGLEHSVAVRLTRRGLRNVGVVWARGVDTAGGDSLFEDYLELTSGRVGYSQSRLGFGDYIFRPWDHSF